MCACVLLCVLVDWLLVASTLATRFKTFRSACHRSLLCLEGDSIPVEHPEGIRDEVVAPCWLHGLPLWAVWRLVCCCPASFTLTP